MSDQPKVNYDTIPSKDLFLVINQIPSTQSMQIQNTNKEYPIQLRVDPVTDYTALGITVIVSIITALISAIVTIKIVTKSNEKLIENEKDLQKNALIHDKAKELAILTSKNRQDWINSLRIDISEVISKTSNIIHNLRATLQLTYQQQTMPNSSVTSKNIQDFSIFISSYQEVDSLISKVELFLNIDNIEQESLINELNTLKSNLLDFCNINLLPDNKFYNKSTEVLKLKTGLSNNLSNISKKVKKIIKDEWEKTKIGE